MRAILSHIGSVLCPLKESFQGDRRTYKGHIRLFWEYLEAHGT